MYVAFDFVDGKGVVPNDSKIIIWTTTPWTIPADLAVTLNPLFEYGLFHTEKGNFVFLLSLKSALQAKLGFKECTLLKSFKGQELELAKVKHPLYRERKHRHLCLFRHRRQRHRLRSYRPGSWRRRFQRLP
jgi:isoleucyl-tRNA synthetase